MAGRSRYNERLLFEDPCDRHSASRSTRYRRAKKRRETEPLPQCPESLATSTVSYEAEDLASSEATATTLFSYDRDNPNLLETEVLGGYEIEPEDEVCEDTISCPVNIPTNSDLLYDGAPLTVTASSIMIMQYKMCHNLTNQALADLLQLLQLHCPRPNQCIPSLYYFKEKFKDRLSMKFHYFCSSCLQNVEEFSNNCTNPLCTTTFECAGNRSSFIEFAIEPQLQILFKCKH